MDKILREQNGRLFSADAKEIGFQGLRAVAERTRQAILTAISEKPMFPGEIAERLGMHEQNIYYHLEKLQKNDLVHVIETKKVRGTFAKRFAPVSSNYIFSLRDEWKPFSGSIKEEHNSFFRPFITNSLLDARIVVGSPDPHGPHRARARDGHYAVDLAFFLGRIAGIPEDFSVSLDVDTDLRTTEKNLIIVGGPVTNILTEELNKHLEKRFSDSGPWGIKGNTIYTEDSIGLVARLPNPFKPSLFVIVAAGIRFIGTKAAVIALTRFTRLTLSRFTGQKKFYAIVQGFDSDADGKIDTIDLLE